MTQSLKILSYNIHKGFTSFNRKFVLEKIRESIRSTHADLLCLQEVMGEGSKSTGAQFEFIADEVWPHFAYGKNATYAKGHHGNAILSKYPIVHWENLDISTNRWEKRGVLYVKIKIPRKKEPLHVFCTHLNLLEGSRKKQIEYLCKKIRELVPPNSPVILAGDFNDWQESLGKILKDSIQIEDVCDSLINQNHATFPSWLPKVRIDRIYQSHFTVNNVHYFGGSIWKLLSDHLPVMAELKWKEP